VNIKVCGRHLVVSIGVTSLPASFSAKAAAAERRSGKSVGSAVASRGLSPEYHNVANNAPRGSNRVALIFTHPRSMAIVYRIAGGS
jgi:hypothetical protein